MNHTKEDEMDVRFLVLLGVFAIVAATGLSWLARRSGGGREGGSSSGGSGGQGPDEIAE